MEINNMAAASIPRSVSRGGGGGGSKEVKTIDEFLDFTRLAKYCNAVLKELN